MTARDELAGAALEGKPLPLPVIDIHAHIGAYNVFHIPRADAAGMVEVMDRCGVAATAISAHGAWAADAHLGNEVVARAVEAYPGRFIGYAVANPHYPDAVEGELRRCFDGFGFRMIKLHPSVHRYELTGENYEAVLRFAARRKAPVLTHTWIGDPHCSPEMAAEAARRHPEVTFLWGHSGGSDVKSATELAAALPNVYLELALSTVFYGQVEYMLTRVGAERLLFGSDFCFISLPQQLGKVVFADISTADKRKILRENSARLLETAGIAVT